MKIALYIEDGLEQITLTPQSDVEKGLVFKLVDHQRAIEAHRGSFYNCRGGWVRQGPGDDSVMLVLRRREADGAGEAETPIPLRSQEGI